MKHDDRSYPSRPLSIVRDAHVALLKYGYVTLFTESAATFYFVSCYRSEEISYEMNGPPFARRFIFYAKLPQRKRQRFFRLLKRLRSIGTLLRGNSMFIELSNLWLEYFFRYRLFFKLSYLALSFFWKFFQRSDAKIWNSETQISFKCKYLCISASNIFVNGN